MKVVRINGDQSPRHNVKLRAHCNALMDADATERRKGTTKRDNNNNSGVQGMENGTIGGEYNEGVV